MTGNSIMMTEMLLLLFRLLRVRLLSVRVFNIFLILFKGCSLNRFTSVYVITSYINFDIIVLSFNIKQKEKKTVKLVEAILGKEKSYPKPVRSEADF